MDTLRDLMTKLYELTTSTMTSGLTEYIRFDVGKEVTGFGSIWGVAEKLCNNVFMPVAVGLLIFFFMLELLNKQTEQNFTIEQFFKLLAKMVVTMFIIKNGFAIFTQILNMGYGLIKLATDNIGVVDPTDTSQNVEIFRSYIADMSMIPLLLVACMMIFPAIFALIIYVLGFTICITRIYTMAIMASGLPLAIVDTYNGMSSHGYRFIKSFIAVCFQGVVMIIILYLSNILSVTITFDPITEASGLVDFLKFLMSSLVIQLATIAMLQKSLQLTKEFLGV